MHGETSGTWTSARRNTGETSQHSPSEATEAVTDVTRACGFRRRSSQTGGCADHRSSRTVDRKSIADLLWSSMKGKRPGSGDPGLSLFSSPCSVHLVQFTSFNSQRFVYRGEQRNMPLAVQAGPSSSLRE